MSRADHFTKTQKQPIHFSDFSITFECNPTTGLLAMTTNEECIKRRLQNLVLTAMGSRPYQPLVGSKAPSLLFDLQTNTTEDMLATTIRQTIESDEPAAILRDLQVEFIPDTNIVGVYISFETINIPNKVFDLTLNLVRVH